MWLSSHALAGDDNELQDNWVMLHSTTQLRRRLVNKNGI